MSAATTTGWIIVFGGTALASFVSAGLALIDGEPGWAAALTLNAAASITCMALLSGVL